MQVVRLKFVKEFIKLSKITNRVYGHIWNGCDDAVVRATQQHQHLILHTLSVSVHCTDLQFFTLCRPRCIVRLRMHLTVMRTAPSWAVILV